MKPWILYVVLAWQVTPISPEEHKTILLQFDSGRECISIAKQVSSQVKAAGSVFYLKKIECIRCKDLYGDKSPHCATPKIVVVPKK